MPRLSRTQERVRERVQDLARRALPPESLGEQLLSALHQAIPADGQQLFGVDPGTLLFNRLLAASQGMLPHALWFLRNRYLTEPVSDLEHPQLMLAGHTVLALQDRPEMSWGVPRQILSGIPTSQWHRTYHERQGPAGGVLRGYFADSGRYVAALVMARFEAGRSFQSGDVAFLRLLAPAIGRALRSALERERASLAAHLGPAAAPHTSGVLVLSPDGRIQLSTPAADAWLVLLRGMEVTGAWEHLPTAVSSAVAALRSRLSAPYCQPAVSVQTPAGPLRIEASVADEAGTAAVMLAPERPPKPPDVPASWLLTRQERQAVALLLRGLSNRQIAAALVVSEHTVESHLRHAYEKIDVRSRTQLLARYFQETYWPALDLSQTSDTARTAAERTPHESAR